MISCHDFRSAFHASTDEPRLLEHVRGCDACLDFAVHEDPDMMFRALGGEDLIPPGGFDAFVGDVMREVRLRAAEGAMVAPRALSWPRKLAAAAAIAATIGGVTFVMQRRHTVPARQVVVSKPSAPAVQHPLTTKPVVETYDSAGATIVEVPTEGTGDTKVVMIFDENLPADL